MCWLAVSHSVDEMLHTCFLLMQPLCETLSAACVLHAGVVFVKLHGKCVDVHEVSWRPYITACVPQARHEPPTLSQPQSRATLP